MVGWGAVVLVAFGTTTIFPDQNEVPRILVRKAAHLGLYAVLGLLCYVALAPPGRRAGLGRALAALALVVAVALLLARQPCLRSGGPVYPSRGIVVGLRRVLSADERVGSTDPGGSPGGVSPSCRFPGACYDRLVQCSLTGPAWKMLGASSGKADTA